MIQDFVGPLQPYPGCRVASPSLSPSVIPLILFLSLSHFPRPSLEAVSPPPPIPEDGQGPGSDCQSRARKVTSLTLYREPSSRWAPPPNPRRCLLLVVSYSTSVTINKLTSRDYYSPRPTVYMHFLMFYLMTLGGIQGSPPQDSFCPLRSSGCTTLCVLAGQLCRAQSQHSVSCPCTQICLSVGGALLLMKWQHLSGLSVTTPWPSHCLHLRGSPSGDQPVLQGWPDVCWVGIALGGVSTVLGQEWALCSRGLTAHCLP